MLCQMAWCRCMGGKHGSGWYALAWSGDWDLWLLHRTHTRQLYWTQTSLHHMALSISRRRIWVSVHLYLLSADSSSIYTREKSIGNFKLKSVKIIWRTTWYPSCLLLCWLEKRTLKCDLWISTKGWLFNVSFPKDPMLILLFALVMIGPMRICSVCLWLHPRLLHLLHPWCADVHYQLQHYSMTPLIVV